MKKEMTIEQVKKLNKLRADVLNISQSRSIILMASLLSSAVFSKDQAEKNIKELTKIREKLLSED